MAHSAFFHHKKYSIICIGSKLRHSFLSNHRVPKIKNKIMLAEARKYSPRATKLCQFGTNAIKHLNFSHKKTFKLFTIYSRTQKGDV
jgi:hypothetical protein